MAPITDGNADPIYPRSIELAPNNSRYAKVEVSMFRIMSIATLVMITVCFFVGASLALASEPPANASAPTHEEQPKDSSEPAADPFEENLAANEAVDEYDFSDYTSGCNTVPVIDAESVEEPELDHMTLIEV